MMAAYYGHHELLQMLIGHKANIDAVSMSGNENLYRCMYVFSMYECIYTCSCEYELNVI